jgi:hypothetical protein
VPPSHLDNATICNRKYRIVVSRLILRETREISKSRQNRHLRANYKAGKAFRLTSHARESYGGMNVAGDYIPAITWTRIVAQHERTDFVRGIDAGHAEIRGWIAGTAVMISAYQHHVEVPITCPPFGERREHPARSSLERVE